MKRSFRELTPEEEEASGATSYGRENTKIKLDHNKMNDMIDVVEEEEKRSVHTNQEGLEKTGGVNLFINIPFMQRQNSFELAIQTPVSAQRFLSTPLHSAVSNEDIKLLNELLKEEINGRNSLLNVQDEGGYTALTTAVTVENKSIGYTMCESLIKAKANVELRDKDGYSALHWAAATGRDDIVKLLVTVGNANINSIDKEGETPLHRSSRLGYVSCVKILLELGADRNYRNNLYLSPIEVMGLYQGIRNIVSRNAIRKVFYSYDSTCRTLILDHPDCLNHATKEGHQEASERVTSIMKKIKGQFNPYEIDIVTDFPIGTLDLVGFAHSNKYIALVMKLAALSSSSGTPVPFTPYVQRSLRGMPADKLKKAENCDTSFSKGSLQAALRAVGAVTHAIDAVLKGTHRNAFCCVRPPGHHAGINGLLKDAISCGFCIFNTVAIGAIYAIGIDKGVKTSYNPIEEIKTTPMSPISNNHNNHNVSIKTISIPKDNDNDTSTNDTTIKTMKSPPSLTSVPDPAVDLSTSASPKAIRPCINTNNTSTSITTTNNSITTITLEPFIETNTKDEKIGYENQKNIITTNNNHDESEFKMPLPSPPRTPRRISGSQQQQQKQQIPSSRRSFFSPLSPKVSSYSSSYSRYNDRMTVERVAIVDFDVHHGNGTQEIVEALRVPDKLFFFSIHLFDKPVHEEYEFYPGSGSQNNITTNCINVGISPLWNKPSISVQKQQNNTNPASPIDSSSWNNRFGRNCFRHKIETVLLPALRAFNPELILVSAGFDGVKHDVGNSRLHDGHRGMDLLPNDYYYTMSRIMDIANMCCNGRVVSVLEGGYGCYPTTRMTPLSPTLEGHSTRSKMKSPANDKDKQQKTTTSSTNTSDKQVEKKKMKEKEEEDPSLVPLDTSVLVNACVAHVNALVFHPKHNSGVGETA